MFAGKTFLLYICFVLAFKSWIHCEGDNKQEGEKLANNTNVKKPIQKLNYTKPSVGDTVLFSEPFHNLEEFEKRWVYSKGKKLDVDDIISRYTGEWAVKSPKNNPLNGDHALVLLSAAKHAAVSAHLTSKFNFDDKPLIVQYEVKFQRKHECGGAYIKLFTDLPSLNLQEITDKTEYVIMFGPDKCGNEDKVHFIIQHENPISTKMEEKHAKKPTKDFSKLFEDERTHLFTLHLKPDSTYEILLDRTTLSSGSLLTDMEPPVSPEKIIDDPNDKRPDDWDEREKIQDLDAKKPDDWDEDEPEMISDMKAIKPSDWQDTVHEWIHDPKAVKPADWDDNEDGEWEAPKIKNPECKPQGCGVWEPPLIKNPDYKGKWTAPLIPNPAYKGIWKLRRIENPDYFEDKNPFSNLKSIAAVGFELWSMQDHLMFDNLIIADDLSIVDKWTDQTWELKRAQEEAEAENATEGLWKSFKQSAEEKPWLWVVAAAAIFIPIVLIAWCCMGSGTKTDEVGRRKKTDEPQSDDEVENEEDDGDDSQRTATEDEGETVEKETLEKEIEKKEKVSSDKEEEKPQENEEEEELVTKEEEQKKNKAAEEVKDEETNEATEQSSPRNRTRRKTRKD